MGIKSNSFLHRYPLPDRHQSVILVGKLYRKEKKDWKTFAKYIVREGVSIDHQESFALSRDGEKIDIEKFVQEHIDSPSTARVWVFTISPEFGESIDLSKLVLRGMDRLHRETGTDFGNVAFVEHHNRLHKHVHMIVPEEGDHIPLRTARDLFKRFLQIEATNMLGPRPEIQIARADELHVSKWIVPLDERILARIDKDRRIVYTRDDTPKSLQDHAFIREERNRLKYLSEIGLAKKLDFPGYEWAISPYFERGLKMSQDVLERVAKFDVLNEQGNVVPSFHVIGGMDVEIAPDDDKGRLRGKLVGIAVRDKSQENFMPSRYELLLLSEDPPEDQKILLVNGGPLGSGVVKLAMDYLGRSVEIDRIGRDDIVIRRDSKMSIELAKQEREERDRVVRTWDNEDQLIMEEFKKTHPELQRHSYGVISGFMELCVESLVFAGINVPGFIEGIEAAHTVEREIEKRHKKGEHALSKESNPQISRDEEFS